MIVCQLPGIDLSLRKCIAGTERETVKLQHALGRQNAKSIDQLVVGIINISREQCVRGDNVACGTFRKVLSRARDKDLLVIDRIYNQRTTGCCSAERRCAAGQGRCRNLNVIKRDHSGLVGTRDDHANPSVTADVTSDVKTQIS